MRNKEMKTSTHFSENQLIKDHPDCEVVNLVGVQLVAEHLRRHVTGCAAFASRHMPEVVVRHRLESDSGAGLEEVA